MNLTKLFALGERKRINDESEKHHNSSTFYQDANYHNQIVNEPSEQMWLGLENSPRTMTATNPRGLTSEEPLLTENKVNFMTRASHLSTHFPDSES